MSHQSRHLMMDNGATDQDASPHFSLASNLINILLSLIILMFILLRGNPRCSKNSKLTKCFCSQLSKAQRKINKVSCTFIFCAVESFIGII